MFITYISYNSKRNEFQIGVTMNLQRRKKILCNQAPACKIVWYEEYENSEQATGRENELLDFPKELLKELVFETNPMLTDLDIN